MIPKLSSGLKLKRKIGKGNTNGRRTNHSVILASPVTGVHHSTSLATIILLGFELLKHGLMAKLYTGNLREREILQNIILSQSAEESHCLCSGSTTYIGSGKDVQGNNIEDKRNKTRTELICIFGQLIEQ